MSARTELLGESVYGFRSDRNRTDTALNNGSTFTGTRDSFASNSVFVTVDTDQSGVLYFDFSDDDGVTWETLPSDGYSVTGGDYFEKMAFKGPRDFRVRFTNDSGTNQTTMRLRTYYGDFGADKYSSGASAPVEVTGPVTEFGELLIAELTPTVQLDSPYGIDPSSRPRELETFSATGGSVDATGNLFRCQSGTSLGGYGVIRSSRTVNYKPGQGIVCRITATFTTGVANSLQFAGLFSLTETLAFGYDGANFSVIHEYDGEAEIQTIQITSSAADTVTVTLDGTAASGISITNATVQTNAREIADALSADAAVNLAWRFEQIDDKVICISRSVGDKTGTMSIAFAGSATGTITETQAGSLKSSDNVAQSSWDNKPFPGFDPTKLNIYQIEYGYLGAANLNFSIYNPNNGSFEKVHTINWSNENTTPNFGNPDMKVGWTSASLGSTGTNLIVTGASCMGGVEGFVGIIEPSVADFNTVSSISTTLTAVITIKNRIVFGGKFNLGSIEPLSVSIDNDHNKGAVVQIVKNATLSGVPNFQYFDESESIVTVDKSSTTVTGGNIIDVLTVGAGLSDSLDLSKFENLLLPEDTLTVAVQTISGTATSTTAAIVWREEK